MRHSLLRHYAEYFSYLGAATLFLCLRIPLLPFWWTDFHSDFAIVGIMAEQTKHGHFPIFFHGQNYMGGAEWLTAALLSFVLDGREYVSMDALRINSLFWWLAAGMMWVVALRRNSLVVSHLFAWIFAAGSYQLLQVSVVQEMSPQYIFFGGLLFLLSQKLHHLAGKEGTLLGVVIGLAWWMNQTVVFFLLPALVLFQALPRRWSQRPLVRELAAPERKLRWLYWVWAALAGAGVVIALGGGLRVGSFKIPNGISLARDVTMVLVLLHGGTKVWRMWRGGRLGELRPLLAFAIGLLLGYAPVWGGRLLGLYEKGYGVGLGLAPIWTWPAQTRALFGSLDLLLFSQGWLVAIALVVVAAGSRFVARDRRLHGLFVYCLSVFFLNVAYVFFSDRTQGAPVRYLYACFVALTLAAAGLIAEMRSSRVRFGFSVFLVLVFIYVGGQNQAALILRGEHMEDRHRNLEMIASTLDDNDLGHCWGDYWTSYLFAFLTEERVILSPHPTAPANQVRIKPYQEALVARNPNCYLYRDGESPTANIYLSGTNPWETR